MEAWNGSIGMMGLRWPRRDGLPRSTGALRYDTVGMEGQQSKA